MTWVASVVSVGAGLAGNLLGNRAKKKAAKAQEALAREQAQKMRDRATEASLATKQEIESLRVMRSMDMPAFRQASETALIQAQKGAERMARQRTMGRLAPDVRQAIFGGQFQQYVGREMQRLEQYAGLTQQILQATERQQQIANQVEQSASGMEYQGLSQAIQSGKRLLITYMDRFGKDSERWVTPIQVTGLSDYLYLRAHCHLRDAERNFRLDRIVRIEVEV